MNRIRTEHKDGRFLKHIKSSKKGLGNQEFKRILIYVLFSNSKLAKLYKLGEYDKFR